MTKWEKAGLVWIVISTPTAIASTTITSAIFWAVLMVAGVIMFMMAGDE